MSAIDALILGLLQVLTEFLPVSSSGHLELGSAYLNLKGTDNLLFSVVVHGATALSTIIVFRKDILQLITGVLKFSWNDETQFTAKIALSMIPVGIVGVLFESQIEAFFGGKVIFVASMLLITAALLIVSQLKGETKGEISYLNAFIIGLAQAFALLPGISRSGATISTALILGVSREKAARFSFLMVLIPIMGATFLKVMDLIESPAGTYTIGTAPLAIGFIGALLSGLVACTWMIKLVKKGNLKYFALYCILLASIVFFIYW